MSPAIAQFLYATALRLATPAYLARLWWRGRVEPLYRRHWRERLGFAPQGFDGSGERLWIHAVSLGETRAAGALIDALRALRPELRLLLTHGTATGREAGRALLREGDAQAWLPWDTPGAVRRFLRAHRPSAGVLMETEVWPGLIEAAAERQVPLVLANARLSEKSLRQGRRFDALMRPAANRLTQAFAQTKDDAERLQRMGAPQVTVMGNLKFDMTVPEALLARGKAWRSDSRRPIVLAASTREGEEAQVLEAWRTATWPADGRPRLWIVPRHPQRFDEVAGLIAARGWATSRRSAWADDRIDDAARSAEVWLGDSLGEMPAYFAAADLALLGGSFEPLGGQNLIEAAACGCPLVMGPSTFNFAQAAQSSLEQGAALRVADMPAALVAASALLSDDARRRQMASAGLAFAQASRGSAMRQARAILEVLDGLAARA